MNIRDGATVWWLILEKVKDQLQDMSNCEDRDEMCAISDELAADIDLVMGEMNDELDLKMGENNETS